MASNIEGQELQERELNPIEQAFVSRMVSFYEGIAQEAGLAVENVTKITDATRVFTESEIRSGAIAVKESTESVVRPEA